MADLSAHCATVLRKRAVVSAAHPACIACEGSITVNSVGTLQTVSAGQNLWEHCFKQMPPMSLAQHAPMNRVAVTTCDCCPAGQLASGSPYSTNHTVLGESMVHNPNINQGLAGNTWHSQTAMSTPWVFSGEYRCSNGFCSFTQDKGSVCAV